MNTINIEINDIVKENLIYYLAIELEYTDNEIRKEEIKNKLNGVSGILIPGGFGKRGTEGKIAAINFAGLIPNTFLTQSPPNLLISPVAVSFTR